MGAVNDNDDHQPESDDAEEVKEEREGGSKRCNCLMFNITKKNLYKYSVFLFLKSTFIS